MFEQTRKSGAVAVAVAILLSACGGGGGGGTQPAAPPVTAPAVQAPAITTQPAAQSVSAGGSASFTVTASGTDLTYQWQRDGKDIAGATSASYTFDNVQSADSGAKFTVVVKNGGGGVTSGAAVLTVLPATARGLAFVAGTLGGPGNLDGAGGRLAAPVRVAMSPDGVLYVADDVSALSWDGYHPHGDTVLRTVNPATGDVATVNPEPLRTTAMVFDRAGNLYEATAAVIYRTPKGGKRAPFAGSATALGHVDGSGSAARFSSVSALAADAQGNVYVADYDVVRKMAPDGSVTTVAGGGALDGAGNPRDGTGAAASFAYITALTVDAGGNVQVIDKGSLRVVTPAGVVSTRTLKNSDPLVSIVTGTAGIAADQAGNVYVTHTYYGCRIRKVAPDGTMSDVAGMQAGRGSSDGKGAGAGFCRTVADYYITWQTSGTDLGNLAVDAAGNLVVADTTNQTIRRVTPDGAVTTVAGRAGSYLGNEEGPADSARFALNTIDYRMASPAFAVRSNYALAADASGTLYVGENDRIRKVAPDGKVGTLPLQAPGTLYARLYLGGLAFGGNAYLADSAKPLSRVNADGSLAALAGVDVGNGENDAIVDALGNLYVKTYSGNGTSTPITTTLRRIAPDGTATTLGDSSAPLGYADAEGNIWGVSVDGTVTRLDKDGKVTVVRTVTATAGAIPLAIARDRAGNLYVAWHEKPNWYSVHKVTPAGVDSVIAGTPGAYGVRLGAPGSLGSIDALTVGMDGNVYVMSENTVLRIGQ